MSVMRFLTQSCDVWRWTDRGSDNDGLPVASWSKVAEGVACRLMHDMGVAAGGVEGGSVQKPRCYFESGTDVAAQDEVVVSLGDGRTVRYAIEQKFGPAEGGNHYDVATLRSELMG